MIFLDNAATSFKKPRAVYKASVEAMHRCASAGRGGYEPSSLASETLYDCRAAIASLYGLDAPERVAFTSNATVGLNMAIKGLVPDGGHVVTTGYEHNAVMRPLTALAKRGVAYTAVQTKLFVPYLPPYSMRMRLRVAAPSIITDSLPLALMKSSSAISLWSFIRLW